MIGFVAGTRIATPMGHVAVERLSSGDLVLTADGRHARLTSVALHHVEEVTRYTAPVRFAIGKMDNVRPLRMAQGHRSASVAGGLRADCYPTSKIQAEPVMTVRPVPIKMDEATTRRAAPYISAKM